MWLSVLPSKDLLSPLESTNIHVSSYRKAVPPPIEKCLQNCIVIAYLFLPLLFPSPDAQTCFRAVLLNDKQVTMNNDEKMFHFLGDR